MFEEYDDDPKPFRWTEPAPEPGPDKRILRFIVGGLILVGVGCFAYAAWGHEARTIGGDPLGWIWPSGCCNSAATHPNGDCALIDPQYVKERPDGYHIDLPIGGHPKLKKKGYSGVVPYSTARNLPTGEYGICLADDGAIRFCFFAGAKGF